MPLKRKKNTNQKKIIIYVLLVIIAGLMIVSFSPKQHMTEVVLLS